MKYRFKNLFGKIVLRILRFLALFYIVAVVVVYFFMDKVLFHGEPLSETHQFQFEKTFREKWITAESDKAHSLYFSTTPSLGLILYFHGNAGNLEDWGFVAQELSSFAQMDVWIIDYPGFGKSPGAIKNEKQLYALAEAMWGEALKKYPEDKIIIYGRSLGTGIATKLASHKKPALVFLETPYKSILSMVRSRVPLMPEWFVPFSFRSDENVKGIDSKRVVIVHGTDDAVIPYTQAQDLWREIPGAQMYTIKNGGHNNLLEYLEFKEARIKIFAALLHSK